MIVTQEQQPQWNSIITGMLRIFITICKKNNLTYYCCGGTAIGAIRHQGMIPWDDDIDVFMPRKDFDRFVQIVNSSSSDDYELETPHINDKYPFYSAKFCNKHTTLLESKDVPCVYGLYIDIFPIDGAPNDYEQARAMERRFTKTKYKLEAISTHISFVEYIMLLTKPKEWGRFVRKTIGFFFRSLYRKHLLQQLDAICYKHKYEDSTLVAVYCGSYGPKEVFPKAWLDGNISFQFEGLNVDLPIGYDDYLRQYYGNYMQLPPEEKRISHHNKAYFNLRERESDEIVYRKAKKSI